MQQLLHGVGLRIYSLGAAIEILFSCIITGIMRWTCLPRQRFTGNDCQRAKEDKSKIKAIWGVSQVSHHAEVGPTGGRELAVKYVTEGEGDGCAKTLERFFLEVLTQVCTHFNETVCDTLLKES